MSSRWTKDEELQFIKYIAKDKSMSYISKKHNRSESALELRLKKIVYDNLVKGVSVDKLSKKLKIDKNKITQYYYSYRDFLESKGKVVEDIKLTNSQATTKVKTKNNMTKDKIEKIEQQNRLLEILIKNNQMKSQVKKLYKNNKFDKKIKKLVKKMIESGLI
jgi:hypothetical protein